MCRNRLQAYERSGREVITARVITDGILAYISLPQNLSKFAVPLLRRFSSPELMNSRTPSKSDADHVRQFWQS